MVVVKVDKTALHFITTIKSFISWDGLKMENQLLSFIFLETGTHSKKDELFLLYEPSAFFTVESPFERSTISLPRDTVALPLKIPNIYLFSAAFSTGEASH